LGFNRYKNKSIFYRYFPEAAVTVFFNAMTNKYSMIKGMGANILNCYLQGKSLDEIQVTITTLSNGQISYTNIKKNIDTVSNWIENELKTLHESDEHPERHSISNQDRIGNGEKDRVWSNIIKLYMHERAPFSAFMEITSKCNFRCIHCYLKDSDNRNSDDLTLTEIKEVLDWLHSKNCFSVTFSGGEPFVRSDFPTILEYAISKGFCVTVFTNGYLLTERHIDYMQELGVQSLEISILGLTDDVYRKITGIEGASHLISLFKKLATSSMSVQMKTPALSANYMQIPQILDLCNTHGLKYNFDIMQFKQGYYSNLDGDIFCSLDEIEWLITQTGTAASAREPMGDLNDDSVNCNSGAYSFTLDPKGYVYPCCSLRFGHLNIRDMPIEDLWNSPHLRAHHHIRRRDLPDCMECSIKEYCRMCPGRALSANGSLIEPDRDICDLMKLSLGR
jgi:radical SAM protein with 4Fe4S-binding SPASM domain